MASNGYNTLNGRTANGMTNLNISRLNAVRAVMNTMNCDVMSTSLMYMNTLNLTYGSVTDLYAENIQVNGTLSATSVYYNNLQAQNASLTSVTIGNLEVYGNISCTGSFYVTSTVVTVTDQFTVSNSGTGPALQVIQTGTNEIARFYDDNNIVMRILDGGQTSAANVRADTLNFNSLTGVVASVGSLTVGSITVINYMNAPTIFNANISVSTQLSAATIYATNTLATTLSSTNLRTYSNDLLGLHQGVTQQIVEKNFYYSVDNKIYKDTYNNYVSSINYRFSYANTAPFLTWMTVSSVGQVAIPVSLSTSSFFVPNMSVTTLLSAATINVQNISATTQLSAATIYAPNVSVSTRLSAATIHVQNISVSTHISATSAYCLTGSIHSLTSVYQSVASATVTIMGINTSADINNSLRVNGHTAMGTNVAYTSLATTSRVLDLCYGPVNTYTINTVNDTNSDLFALVNANGNDSNSNHYTSFNMQVTGQYGSITDHCIGNISFVRDISNEPGGSFYFKTRTNNTAAYNYRDIARFGYSSCFISPGNNGPIVIGSQSPNATGYNLCLGTPYGGTQTLELGVISTIVRGSIIIENNLSVLGTLSAATSRLTNVSIITASITTLYNTNASIATLYISSEIETPYLITTDISVTGSLSVGNINVGSLTVNTYIRQVASENSVSSYVPSCYPNISYMYYSNNVWPSGYNYVVLTVPFTFSVDVFSAWQSAGAQFNVNFTMQQRDTSNNGAYRAIISYSIKWLTNAYYPQYHAIQDANDDGMPGTFNMAIHSAAIRHKSGLNPNGFVLIFTPGVTFNGTYYYMAQANASIVCPGFDVSKPSWSVTNDLTDYVTYYIP